MSAPGLATKVTALRGLVCDLDSKKPQSAPQFRFGFDREQLVGLRDRFDAAGVTTGYLRGYLDKLLAGCLSMHRIVFIITSVFTPPWGMSLQELLKTTTNSC